MTLRINRVKVDIATSDARYGCDFSFREGLNVIRAENTCGKTTCSLAILYALGLEGMLQASHEVPMADVVTSKLLDGDVEHAINQSYVLLEISNETGGKATIKRAIKSPGTDHRLVAVWNGFALSDPGTASDQKDLFVRVARSAQSESGFHHWLKSFIGWVMPAIPANDGGEMLLYLEQIAPLHYVEQKRGWSGIQAGTPSFGARDPAKRALEFVLGLSGPTNIIARERLRDEINGIRERWKALLNRTDEIALLISGRVAGLPELPSAAWPPAPMPFIEIAAPGEKVSADLALSRIQEQFASLRDEVIPTIKAASNEIEQRLKDLGDKFMKVGGIRNALSEQLEQECAYFASATHRLETLREELLRNKDAKKLQEMGASYLGIDNLSNCHTCGQLLPASLFPAGSGIPVMTIDENIAFLESQIESVSSFNSKLERVVAQRRAALAGIDQEQSITATQVRDLKESLLEDGRLPSLEAIRSKIILEERAKSFSQTIDLFSRRLAEFSHLSEQFRTAQAQLQAIPSQAVPQDDRNKLAVLQRSLLEQLRLYGFISFPIEQIEISDLTYRPTREGTEVGYSVSASDMIRLIWSYIIGLMECSHACGGRHAGLVIFDEPKQQSARDASFRALLSRSVASKSRNQQVIIFTSETEDSLRQMLTGIEANVSWVSGRIIKKT